MLVIDGKKIHVGHLGVKISREVISTFSRILVSRMYGEHSSQETVYYK